MELDSFGIVPQFKQKVETKFARLQGDGRTKL